MANFIPFMLVIGCIAQCVFEVRTNRIEKTADGGAFNLIHGGDAVKLSFGTLTAFSLAAKFNFPADVYGTIVLPQGDKKKIMANFILCMLVIGCISQITLQTDTDPSVPKTRHTTEEERKMLKNYLNSQKKETAMPLDEHTLLVEEIKIEKNDMGSTGTVEPDLTTFGKDPNNPSAYFLKSLDTVKFAGGGVMTLDTNIKRIKLPKGYYGIILPARDRSTKNKISTTHNMIKNENSYSIVEGLITDQHDGPVRVSVMNSRPSTMDIKRGQRFAQMIIVKNEQLEVGTFPATADKPAENGEDGEEGKE